MKTIPEGVARRLEELLRGEGGLAAEAQALSQRYRNAQGAAGKGISLLKGRRDALAYAATRMPATFAAVSSALEAASVCLPETPARCLDVGAGPGTASLAARALWPKIKLCLLEKDEHMRALSQTLLQAEDARAELVAGDLCTAELPGADLVIAAYCLLELNDDVLEETAMKLFDAAFQTLLIVEPGTPAGFQRLTRIREALCAAGAYVAAPCPGRAHCPLPADDWCAFAQRLPRTSAHRRQKGASLGYEDEKYCYLALTHQKPQPVCARVLRHPLIYKGYVDIKLCTLGGIQAQRLTKKSPLYREARDKNAGDSLVLDKAE